MEIEIISKENIKPSSPTPSHLRNYKVSLLDQNVASIYVPMVLVYPQNTTDHHLTSRRTSQLLKESLSKTLSQFYPFAGKFKDSLSIDCNDEGAYYVEARVKAHMTEGFLKHPNLALLQKFLPREFSWPVAGPGCHVSMFQVNLFDCGGIVIGVGVSHKMADGIAISTFLKSWAAIASGSDQAESLSPSYISSSLFPQNDIALQVETMSPLLKKGKSVTRRFTFNAESLSALKAKATNIRNGHIPSRVQSVTALIWKSFIATLTSLSAAQKPPFVIHAVDIRRRASPPFSESCMGNWIWGVMASCKDECGIELDQLVGEINNTIKKVDAEFVENIEDTVFKFYEALNGNSQQNEKEAADYLLFTSWYNFGLYKVDFGWGKPELATTTLTLNIDSIYMNAVLLKETKDGEGMEALVNLSEKEMAIFERETELLHYAVVDGDGDKLDGESG